MKFAKIVFLAGGVWGIVLVTPLYFLFDLIGRRNGAPITYPQIYYGFVSVALAWQFAFLVIGSDPVRYRGMMIPSMAEKIIYGLTMAILYAQGRIGLADVLPIVPDLGLCALFAVAFVKTSAAVQEVPPFRGVSWPLPDRQRS